VNESADQLPGFSDAVEVLRRVGGVLLPADAAHALSGALILTVTPHVKAETLADIADDLYAAADQSPHPRVYRELRAFADALDTASHHIREALNRT
jgi:hypothetical protein